MKLENQVCTPVQSIRLKELGVIQESNYQWNLTTHAEPYLNVPPFGKVDNNGLSYSAFTVAELGVMLPEEVKTTKHFGSRGMDMSDGLTGEYFSCESEQASTYSLYEAKAKAQFLIYLLENNLTTAAEVNERLKQN